MDFTMKFLQRQKYYKIKMINNKLNFYTRKVLWLSAIFFLIGFVSCKKDGELNPEFDDGGLAINFVDTFSITSQVVLEDSLRSDLSVFNLLGLYHDPIFGPMSSSLYAQVTLTGINVDLDSDVSTLDSIVLTMDYEALYGDTASPMSINVYELSTALSNNNDYYSNTRTSFNSTPIGSLTFTPNLEDSVSIAFDTLKRAPHLRIKLNNTFGQTLMNGDASGSDDMKNNTAFTEFFKGLYITTSDSVSNTSLTPNQGSIVSFNMNSSLSTLTIYYNDTSKYDFTINTDGVKYCRFEHNYSGTDIESHLTNSPSRDTTITYVSTMAGVKTKLEIPNIKNIAEGGAVVINKAELVVTVENGTEGNFDTPLESISLVGIDENGEQFFLPDFFEGITHFGGDYESGDKTYKFNIARHINDLVYGTNNNYGLYIIANGASITARRSILTSEKNSTTKIKLNITYSKI